jgi:hypothetical protein
VPRGLLISRVSGKRASVVWEGRTISAAKLLINFS